MDVIEIGMEEFDSSNHTNTDSEREVHTSSDAFIFDSSIDAKYYTLKDFNPNSVAEQELGYILDIRNILLIFLCCYVVIRLYGTLKNTISSYFS